MAWANFSILAIGGLLASIPVLLHLLMRQRPRHQTFPALRFLKKKQIANKRQMRLRNWILLALRILAVLLLAMLFARPSVDSLHAGTWVKTGVFAVLAPVAIIAFLFCWIDRRGTFMVAITGLLSLILSVFLGIFGFQAVVSSEGREIGNADAPVAAVLVVDTSPRMGLVHQNESRLDVAKGIAEEVIKQLPADSEVAIVDGSGAHSFAINSGAALHMIDSLHVLGQEMQLSQLLSQGIQLAGSRDDLRSEVYVFSDMSERVWDVDEYRGVRNQLDTDLDISLFVLDAGVEEPKNVSLGDVRLPQESLVRGQQLRLETEIHSLNAEASLSIDVFIEQPDPSRPVMMDGELLLPELTRRERVVEDIAPGDKVPVVFDLPGLPVGVHHGQVQVKSNDGLQIDDVRFFTVVVRPPFPVLLVNGKGAQVRHLREAISPREFVQRDAAVFSCDVCSPENILERSLDEYSVVALLDPAPMPQHTWNALEEYVRRGGAMAIFLGRNVRSVDEFNAQAGGLLPGPLKAHWRVGNGESLFFSLRGTSHPMLRLFRDQNVPWDGAPVYRHWTLDELKPGANVVLEFTNARPAVLEYAVGKGNVVLMTTPVSDHRRNSDRPAWNDFATSQEPLPFFMLMNGLFPYLSGQDDLRHNLVVGQQASFSAGVQSPVAAAGSTTFELMLPQGDWQNVHSEDGVLNVAATETPGTYRLRPAIPTGQRLGFSANLAVASTDVKRLSLTRLDEILGKERYSLNRTTRQLRQGVGRARVGTEMFPFLILVVVGLLAFEHLMSNRFYGPGARRSTERQ